MGDIEHDASDVGGRPTLEELRASPNVLARDYTAFRVAERLLLTGHSHQAWPDAGFEGQRQAWMDAAELVDAKWDRVAEKVSCVAEGFRRLMGGCDGDLTVETNTHALVVRFLSALPLLDRPRIVTTDGEFHSVRRQLDRLAEEGVEVVKVPVDPVADLAERVAASVDDRTACAIVSSVLFETGRIVPHLPAVAEACASYGAELLIDAYHSLGVVPFGLDGMERAFVVGGGYKYCQLGEGNCVLRVPPECSLRPVVTGWFAEFAELGGERETPRVVYGAGPARFAGSTFDPTSAYRAAAVFDFFDARGLDVALLRDVSRHQVGLLVRTFRSLDLDPGVATLELAAPGEASTAASDGGVELEGRGGFLALRAVDAAGLQRGLLERGVRTDARGPFLRFGPAPYLSDAQIVQAMEALAEVVRRRP